MCAIQEQYVSPKRMPHRIAIHGSTTAAADGSFGFSCSCDGRVGYSFVSICDVSAIFVSGSLVIKGHSLSSQF